MQQEQEQCMVFSPSWHGKPARRAQKSPVNMANSCTSLECKTFLGGGSKNVSTHEPFQTPPILTANCMGSKSWFGFWITRSSVKVLFLHIQHSKNGINQLWPIKAGDLIFLSPRVTWLQENPLSILKWFARKGI